MKSDNGKRTTSLLLDILIFAILLLCFEHRATGIVLHEWLGITVAVALIAHIILHWKWISCVILNIFSEKSKHQRLKFVLDILIFFSFSTIVFTGLMISRSSLQLMGLKTAATPFWKSLHFISVDIVIWLIAFHIALNWPMIMKTIKNIKPVFGYSLKRQMLKFFTPVPAGDPRSFGITEGTHLPSPVTSVLNKIFNLSLKIFLILLASAVISVAWYGLSSESPGRASGFHHYRESFFAHDDPITEGSHRGSYRRREINDTMMSHRLELRRHDDEFSPVYILPGMVKNILIISLITAAIAYIGNKRKPQNKA